MEQSARATFVKVIVAVLVVLTGVGFLIRAADAGHHRPEGAAERWLAAVADTTRRGVNADARKRADRIGPVTLAASLLPVNPDPRRSAFSDLEVGKAQRDPEVPGGVPGGHTAAVRVPFRLHPQLRSGTGSVRRGTLVLEQDQGAWRVSAVVDRRPGELVRSEGGPPPSRAPLVLWLGALGLGLVLAVGAHLIVRWADRSARRALAAASAVAP